MPTNTATLPMIETEPAASPQRRGLGRMLVTEAEGQRALPLAGVDIRARVIDRVAQVEVRQRFVNDHAEAIEAVYVFPLSGGCAVADFELTVAGRTIKGVLAEREAARQQYAEALRQGKRAAMLEQERSDVFTISVGNLPPGQEALVRIVYSERLPFFEDGQTELRLPLVVAPRYIPGQPLEGSSVGDGTEPDTDQVPDASRITPPRLAPGVDPKTALALEVELLGTAADLACSQHAFSQRSHDGTTIVSLSRDDERLDRDFVLRWRLAHDDLSPSLVCYTDATGGVYGLLSLLAPRSAQAPSSRRDIVFVFDRSGSMSGPKIASAARACALLLRTLGPADRFALLAFDTAYEWFGDAPRFVVADEDGLARGERWLREIGARGGTEIDGALARACALIEGRVDAAGRDAAIVLVTDGEVGNESAVIARVQKAAGHARVFPVGVDTAVNGEFIDRLAEAGRGTSALVQPGSSLERALVSIGRDIGRPLVTDLSITGTDGTVIDERTIAPSRIGDLFGGRATMIAFRASAPGPVRVRGTRHDGQPFDVTVAPRAAALPAIAHVWAREHLTDLEDAYRLEPDRADALRDQIVETSIAHGVLTRFTAFLAVDERDAVANPSERRKIVQPVEIPALWDTSVLSMGAALPFASDALAQRATAPAGWLRGAPEIALSGLAKRALRNVVSAPDTSALHSTLTELMESLDKARQQSAARPAFDVHRIRELRDGVAALEQALVGGVRRWVQQLLGALDRLVQLLEDQSRLDERVREAVEALEQVIKATPLSRAGARRRRFWERGV